MPAPAFTLRVTRGPLAGREFPLAGPLVFGRGEDCDLRLLDETVSRRHARLEASPEGPLLKDLGSSNGTYVNEARITEKILFPGDLLRVGASEFTLTSSATDAMRSTVMAPASGEALAKVEASILPERGDILEVHPSAGQLSSLYRLLREMPAQCPPDRVAEAWLSLLVKELGASSGSVLLCEGVQEKVLTVPPGPTAPISRTVRQRVSERGESLLVAELASSPWASASASLAAAKTASLIAAPVLCGEEPPGLLVLVRLASAPPFGATDLAVATEAARVLGRTLSGARTQAARSRQLGRLVARESDLVGDAPAFLAAVDMARRAAPTSCTVLVMGPTGSGKELIARLIHRESPRAEGPFVPVNCAAIPEGLQESDLFGHEKGAFTGAVRARDGSFALADGGTLFLDEIGELALAAQAKLLRVLETRTFHRVGASASTRVDIRLVAATHRDLPAEIAAGRFREDLFHRLNVVAVSMPPLSGRPGDVPVLATYLLRRKAMELALPPRAITPEALDALGAYSWPGNIRELANVLERALVLSRGSEIGLEDLPAEIVRPAGARGTPAAPPRTLAEYERQAVMEALEATGWNKRAAADRLGISWPTLHKKVIEYGLKAPESLPKEE